MVISLQEIKFGMEELKTRRELKSCMQRHFYVPFLLHWGNQRWVLPVKCVFWKGDHSENFLLFSPYLFS